ncbi:MAG: hypothetical protein H6Q75_519 [Firmicutes bacterium]|nr:hypothetical protein [Bacillota bacterium]
MKYSPMSTVAKAAATYVGTIIGAGFASGQEIVQFFSCYGSLGLIGIAVATLLFAWLGYALLELGYSLKADSYSSAMYALCGPYIGMLLDIVTVIFLFTTLSIMLAGATTLLTECFNLPYALSLCAASALIIITSSRGVNGISSANMVIAPLLIFSIISICVYSFFYHSFSSATLPPFFPYDSTTFFHCLVASFLYVSYNLVMGATVLIPLGKTIRNHRCRFLSGVIGGTVLGLLAAFLAVVILLHYPAALYQEVPLLEIASNQYSWSGIAYTCTLIAAMYTTAIASLYGCTVKISQVTKNSFHFSMLAITCLAAVFSNVGFAALIRIMFPLFGWATLIFTFRLLWVSIRDIR